MLKLLETYLAKPTLTNAKKVVSHADRHPMVYCMLTKDALDTLGAAKLHAFYGVLPYGKVEA